MAKKKLRADQKLPLALTEAERKLILNGVTHIEDEYTSAIRATATETPVEFTWNNWERLAGCIAVEANSTRDRRLKRSLERLFARITKLLDECPDHVPDLKIYRGEEDAP